MTGRILVVAPVTLLLAGLLALLGAGLARQASASASTSQASNVVAEARPAPEVVLSGFDGRTTKLSDLRGQVVVVNFWASWCAPCRDETAALEKVWQSYRSQDVAFVGVATWDGEQAARDFAKQAGVTYLEGTDAKGDAAVQYRITGIPETFLIDQHGQIVRRWIGQVDEAGLSAALATQVQRGPLALGATLWNLTRAGRA